MPPLYLIQWFRYGRVLSRPCQGIDVKTRELLTLACLTGPPIVFPQVW